MASPPGTNADQAGIWQSAMCFRVLAALSAAALLPRGQELQRMPQGAMLGWGGVKVSSTLDPLLTNHLYSLRLLLCTPRNTLFLDTHSHCIFL
jgi:hypothetical protein